MQEDEFFNSRVVRDLMPLSKKLMSSFLTVWRKSWLMFADKVYTRDLFGND